MKIRVPFPVLARVIADLILLIASVALAFLLRFIYTVTFEGTGQSDLFVFRHLIEVFWVTLAYLVPLNLVSFALFGIYKRTRAYFWRAKTLAITKAIGMTYLLVAVAEFSVPDGIRTPRSILPIAFIISLTCMLVTRAWSSLWRRVLIEEAPQAELKARDSKALLLIGGAGYIGSALVPKLLSAGYRIRLLDAFLFGREPLGDWADHPNLELIEGDFRRVERVVTSMKGVSVVVHLGGIVGDPACALDEQLTIEVNLAATRLIAEVAKGEGVKRFVFASTCSVYGANDNVLDENSRLNPVSLYARSKIASEQALFAAQNKGGLAPTVLRFGTIFGLSGRTRFDLVVNLLTAKALFDKKITLYGGDQWRPFLHVDDAAASVLAVLEAPLECVAGETFNIGSNDMNYTLRQVGELIHKRVPDAELLELGQDGDRRNYRVDFSKAHQKLGFLPKWKLEAGIDQVAEAIRSGRVTDYRLAKYSNVKFLSDNRTCLAMTDGWEREILRSLAPGDAMAVQE